MSEELTTIDLVTRRDPTVVLEEARRAAIAIKSVIDAKPDKVIMNGQTYLEFEDWQTLGRFYGLAVEIESTKPVAFEDVRGWEAAAVVKLVSTGQIVSRAEAMCLNDEEKWRARPKYEWQYVLKDGSMQTEDPGRDQIVWEKRQDGKGSAPKKKRVLVGEEAVPMFQLRSMAQTRSGAKAFRNILAWVVVLAGYRPTPAEELDGLGAERVSNAQETSVIETDTRPKDAEVDGSVRVIQSKVEGEALQVILHTGEVLRAPMIRKHLCAEIGELAKEQAVIFSVSNGWITKMTLVPMVVLTPSELKADDIDFGGGERSPVL